MSEQIRIALKYNEANDKYFSKDGPPAYIVTKDIDYYNNFAELHRFGEFDVPNNTFILDNSVRFWLLEYEQYLNRSSVPPFFINEYKDQLIDDPQNSTLQIPPNKKDFRDWLKDYVKEDNPGNRFESDLVFKGGDGSDSNFHPSR